MTKIFQKEKISEEIQIWGRNEKNSSVKTSYEKNIIGEQSLENINVKILNVVRVKIVRVCEVYGARWSFTSIYKLLYLDWETGI